MAVKLKTNFWWDFLLFINLVILGFTGMIMRYTLPPGTGESHKLLGLGRHDFGSVHFWAALVMLAQILLHFAFHYKWIASVIQREWKLSGLLKGWAVFLLGALIVALPIFFKGQRVKEVSGDQRQSSGHPQESISLSHAARSPGQVDREGAPLSQPEHPSRPVPGEEYRVDDIAGSWTLKDVEEYLKVSAVTMKERLGIPAELPDSTKLRDIKSHYKIGLSRIRGVIAEEQGLIPR